MIKKKVKLNPKTSNIHVCHVTCRKAKYSSLKLKGCLSACLGIPIIFPAFFKLDYNSMFLPQK